jgi:hypothetical protein
MFSSMLWFTIQRNPMSIKAASVIASAITKRLLIVVTEAPYVAVTGVSGSLYNARHDHLLVQLLALADRSDEARPPVRRQDQEPVTCWPGSIMISSRGWAQIELAARHDAQMDRKHAADRASKWS